MGMFIGRFAAWLLLLSPFIILFLIFVRAWRRGQRETAELTNAYMAALDSLQANPSDPAARPRCLVTGRQYYAKVMPDTFDYILGKVFSAHNFRSNAPGREAKIAADIEARIGHLKTPQQK